MTAAQQDDDFVHSVSTGTHDDQALVAALRNGDESAFVHLLDRYGGMMVRLALIYVPSRAVAEEVVQETWLAVFQGLSRFEERSSLKTWILRILTNRAKTRGEREGRSVPFSAREDSDLDSAEPAVAAERFLPPNHEHWPGHWSSVPQRWDALPEQQLLACRLFFCPVGQKPTKGSKSVVCVSPSTTLSGGDDARTNNAGRIPHSDHTI